MAYMGKMLRVNLSNQTIKTEELPKELAKQYLGGFFGAKFKATGCDIIF